MDSKVGFHGDLTSNVTAFPGGQLILGQSRNISGAINSDQSLRADILHFNMWDHVFTAQEVLHVYSNCSVHLGTLVSWPDVQVRVYGNIKRIEIVRCQANGKPYL